MLPINISKSIKASLSLFEKEHVEWEWTDLMNWLQSIKRQVQAQSLSLASSTLLELGLRLSQCLHPSLPAGLHSTALEVYATFLGSVKTTDFHYFSSGLFGFFEHCSTQNKYQYLDLIKDFYLPHPAALSSTLPGVVASLLSGADDTPEIFLKVKDLLELFSVKVRSLIQLSVWEFVNSSQQYRSAGLKYMHSYLDPRLHAEIAVQALVNAFEDSSVQVKRQALDIVKTHYSISSKVLSKELMVKLMQGALALFQYKDLTLTRRLWDWIGGEEAVNIVAPALARVLQNFAQSDSDKIAVIRIADVLFEHELIGLQLIELAGVAYLRHIVRNNGCFINGKEDGRAVLMFYEEKASTLWGAFTEFLSNHLYGSYAECIAVLTFATTKVPCKPAEMRQVLERLLLALSMPFLPVLLMERCAEMSRLIEKTPRKGSKHLLALFSSMTEDQQEAMLLIAKILGNFKALGMDISSATEHAGQIQDSLLRIEVLLNLKSKEFGLQDIQLLWDLIGYNTRAMNLLLAMQPLMPNLWAQSVSVVLSARDIYVQQKAVKTFALFWGKLSTENPETLRTCMADGKIVFSMIDLLSHSSTIVRHTASKWLFNIRSNVGSLFDPLLSVLLHANTRREKKGGLFLYAQEYYIQKTREAFKRVTSVVDTRPAIKQVMENSPVSEQTAELLRVHQIAATNYLEAILDAAILFLNSVSAYQRAENELVQSTACELVQTYVKDLPSYLAFKALRGTSESLFRSVLNQDGASQVLVMRTIRNILYFTEISHNSEEFTKFLQNDDFSNALFRGLYTSDVFLRSHWVGFINEILPFCLKFLDASTLTRYVQTFLKSYIEIIHNTGDVNLLAGIRQLIHKVLGIQEGVQPYPEVQDLVFEELNSLFRLCLFVCNKMDVRKKGAYSNYEVEDELKLLFLGISNNFSQELRNGILEFWSSMCSAKESSHSSFIKIFPCFNCDLSIILQEIYQKKGKIDLAYFVYFVVGYQTIDTMICDSIIKILKQLLQSSSEESIVMIMAILSILPMNYSRSLSKDVLQVTEDCISKGCEYMLRTHRLAYDIPHLYIEDDRPMSVSTLILISFKKNLLGVIRKYIPTKLVQIVQAVLTSLFAGVSNNVIKEPVAGELIFILLVNTELKIVKNYVNPYINFMCSPNFLLNCQNYPDNMKVWGDVSERMGEVFTDKGALLAECLGKFEPSFFTLASKASLLSKNSYLMLVVLLMHGEEDTYKDSLELFLEKIHNSLEAKEEFPFVCLLIRALIIRLNKKAFMEIWSKTWPTLHSSLLKYIGKPSDLNLALAGIKLLDLLITVNYDEFYSVLWTFFYDATEIRLRKEQNTYYQPLFASRFYKGMTAKPMRNGERTGCLHQRVAKVPLVPVQEITGVDDIAMHLSMLNQACMEYNCLITRSDFKAVELSIEIDLISLNKQLNFT